MTRLAVGEKVKVPYKDGHEYTLEVEVTAICPSDEFIGRIEIVFAAGDGEVTRGDILDLKGQKMTFKNEDIVLRRTDLP
jgi:hypothetical protein